MGLQGYLMLGEVGSGSTGTVFRARQEALGREVAVKALDPALAADEAFRERFRAEARVLAGLSDPHLATLYDFVEDASGAWIVQQWVDGSSLEQVVASHGPLAAEQAVGVVRGALLGLTVAHRAGVVHGDVSTGNILVTSDGVSTLVDFGLAGPSGSPGAAGTAAFVSPEAAAGAPLTFRSDVYSVCQVLHHLLGGDPGELAGVLRRGLATNPSERPADAAELLALLEDAAKRRFGAGWLTRASVAGLATSAAAVAGTQVTGAPAVQPQPVADVVELPVEHGAGLSTGRKRLVAIGAATALVLTAITGAAFAMGKSGADTPSASAPTATATATDGSEPAAEQEPAFAGNYTLTSVVTEVVNPQYFAGNVEDAPGVGDTSRVIVKVVPECDSGPCGVSLTMSGDRYGGFAYDGQQWVSDETTAETCFDSSAQVTGTPGAPIELRSSDTLRPSGGADDPYAVLSGSIVVTYSGTCNGVTGASVARDYTLTRTTQGTFEE